MGSDGLVVVRVGWVFGCLIGFENSQIGTCFRPLGGEAGDYNETE